MIKNALEPQTLVGLLIYTFRKKDSCKIGVDRSFFPAFSYLLLFSVPGLSAPFYTYEQGISLFDVDPNSVVRGKTGLEVGDVIHAVNECRVTDIPTWRLCLIQAIAQPTPSFCMHREMISLSDSSVILPTTTKSPASEDDDKSPAREDKTIVECCGVDGRNSSLCFVDVGGRGPGHPTVKEEEKGWKGHACLGVRKALEQSVQRCNATTACGTDSNYVCMQVCRATDRSSTLYL